MNFNNYKELQNYLKSLGLNGNVAGNLIRAILFHKNNNYPIEQQIILNEIKQINDINYKSYKLGKIGLEQIKQVQNKLFNQNNNQGNKYQEYLEKAHERYYTSDVNLESLLEWINDETKYLKKLKLMKDIDYGFKCVNERNEEIMYIYGADKNREKIIDLLIDSCSYDLKLMKALIYEILEKGDFFEDE